MRQAKHLYLLTCALAILLASCDNETFEDPISTTVPSEEFTVKDTVKVYFDESSATVSVPLGRTDVTYETDNGYVTITNACDTTELVFVLAGTSTDGGLTYNGTYKCTFVLNGLSLTSTQGAALDIECGKRIYIKLPEDTENYLEDCADGTQKGCLYTKGHIKMVGSGNLTVKGNTKNGIHVKEYLKLGESLGTLTITDVVNHAISVGEEFEMEGGTLELVAQNMDTKALKCDSTVTISGGTMNITADGDGSRGIQADYDITINESTGTTTITVAANGGKCSEEDEHRCMGIKTDQTFKMSAGTVTVTTVKNSARGIRCLTKEVTGGTCNAEFKEGE